MDCTEGIEENILLALQIKAFPLPWFRPIEGILLRSFSHAFERGVFVSIHWGAGKACSQVGGGFVRDLHSIST